VAIPPFREDGWLPEGHWPATWEEVEEHFGGLPDSRRRLLFKRLTHWRDELRKYNISGRLILNGSFISTKVVPGDIDGFLIIDERSEVELLNRPEAMDLINYNSVKDRGLGDVLCYTATAVRNHPTFCRVDGFDLDKRTLKPKGLIEVVL
jgi:hypothetical protein